MFIVLNKTWLSTDWRKTSVCFYLEIISTPALIRFQPWMFNDFPWNFPINLWCSHEKTPISAHRARLMPCDRTATERGPQPFQPFLPFLFPWRLENLCRILCWCPCFFSVGTWGIAEFNMGFTQDFDKIWRYEGFLKWGYPQIIHFNGIFPYIPTTFGYPHFWKPPYWIWGLFIGIITVHDHDVTNCGIDGPVWRGRLSENRLAMSMKQLVDHPFLIVPEVDGIIHPLKYGWSVALRSVATRCFGAVELWKTQQQWG